LSGTVGVVRPVVSRVLVSAALAASASIATSLPARAHDSLAPRGAEHDWLPHEEWVFRHWIPFDVRQLEQAVGLSDRELEAYLFNDHRVLADLARSRGIDVDHLADTLVAPWRSQVDDARLSAMRDRTMRLLTQGHLAQHVFLHGFHTMRAEAVVARTLHVSRARFRRLRMTGRSAREIARRRGIPPARVRRHMVSLFRTHHDDGIRLLQAWPASSGRLLAEQVTAVPCWTRTPLPTLDSGNPFGKAQRQHGVHTAGWPSTAQQQRIDERRVERARRALTPSCWRQPRAWRWSLQTASTASSERRLAVDKFHERRLAGTSVDVNEAAGSAHPGPHRGRALVRPLRRLYCSGIG